MELAKKIGVSRQTLSVILNGSWKKKSISEATYERVTNSINEMGFVPQKSAVQLRKAEPNLIGIVYYGKLHSHLLAAIQQSNNFFQEQSQPVKIVLSRKQGLVAAIQDLLGDRVERIAIIMAISAPDFGSELKEKNIQHLLKTVPSVIYNFPFDIHGRSLEKDLLECGTSLIGFSRLKIYRELLREVLKTKSKRIIVARDILNYLQINPSTSRLLSSFDLVLSYSTPPSENALVNEFTLGANIAAELSTKIRTEKIDLIITDSDMIAEGIISQLDTDGFEIPSEVAVIGFDDIDAAPFFKVPVTTIKVPLESMVNDLVNTLGKMKAETVSLKTKAVIIWRESFPKTTNS